MPEPIQSAGREKFIPEIYPLRCGESVHGAAPHTTVNATIFAVKIKTGATLSVEASYIMYRKPARALSFAGGYEKEFP